MSGVQDALLALVALLNLAMLASGRARTGIRLAAVEGFALGFLPPLAHGDVHLRPLLLAAGTVALKGVVFPWLLARALRPGAGRREADADLGAAVSLVLGVGFVIAGLLIGARLPLPPGVAHGSGLALPVACAGVLTGLLLIVSRRQAVSQVVGYLVLENGVFVFGVALVKDSPFLVELGVLLDVFVAVFIMGIAIFHIGRVLDHTDTGRLTALRE